MPTAITTAQRALDAWDPDEADQSTIDNVFRAIYWRFPLEEEDAVTHIYAARRVLTEDEARDVLRILG